MYSRMILKSVSLNKRVNWLFKRFASNEKPSLYELGQKCIISNEINGYIVKSPYESISIPDLTIDQYVWKNMPKWPNHIAIVCGITGRKYTYAKLRDHCAALAIRLRINLNLEKNDIVGICLPNVPEYPIAWLGSAEAGLVVTTINPWYTSEEVARQLTSSQPKVIFCLIDHFDVVKKACVIAQQPDIKVIAIKHELSQSFRSDMINFNELINPKGLNLSDASQFNRETNYDDMTVLPYSSGTTGLPKGVMLSHNNLVSNCEAMDVNLPHNRLILPTSNDYQDVLPCFLPFYHAYGLIILLLSKLALGTKIVSIPKYDMNQFLRIIKDHKATCLHLVPPVVISLGNCENAKSEHFKYVRLMMSAASNLAETDVDRFKKIAQDATFVQGYGLTETSPICTLTPLGCGNYGSIGWAASNIEMKIVSLNDSSSKGLGPNETGELWTKGPNVMKGYFKNEEATKAMITEDKWLRTGDIGHFDEMGLFYISDRLKELIKVNANQVAPAELEGILRQHPDILDAVVIGVSHPKYGEVPKAFVIRRVDSNTTEENIQEFVAKQVIKYKRLTGGVQFVNEIPKTATGKILRREIRKIFGQSTSYTNTK